MFVEAQGVGGFPLDTKYIYDMVSDIIFELSRVVLCSHASVSLEHGNVAETRSFLCASPSKHVSFISQITTKVLHTMKPCAL
jgi:hypothetical protein